MGIMSSAANDRWREAQKECEILRRANDDYIKTATEQCLRINALEAELAEAVRGGRNGAGEAFRSK